MFIALLALLLPNESRVSAVSCLRTHRRGLSRSCLQMSKQEATLGMGCFWGPQEKFDKMTGIKDSKAGYSGGDNLNPTYKSVCSGDGHIEAVRIEYDDSEVSYDEILDVFFDRDVNSFGNGMGQYQSTIWTENATQKELVEKRLNDLSLKNDPRSKLVTVREKETFYVAETYHQKYNTKQFPRYIVLAIAALLDVIPGLPQEAYKLGLILTVGYVVLTVGERFIDGPGALKKIN
jgi:peptide-methionine (S)-S-oxide reductase